MARAQPPAFEGAKHFAFVPRGSPWRPAREAGVPGPGDRGFRVSLPAGFVRGGPRQRHPAPGRRGRDRLPPRAAAHPRLRPSPSNPARRYLHRRPDHRLASELTKARSPLSKGARKESRDARRWRKRARVTIRHARNREVWGITVSEARAAPYVHDRLRPDRGILACCSSCPMSGANYGAS
jgi:hypothetical protein